MYSAAINFNRYGCMYFFCFFIRCNARAFLLVISNILHYVFIPMYAAELGVDPQDDFAHRPESQGLPGSAILCFPSGAPLVKTDTHL